MGGTTPLEGRVEIFLLGHWGTVCDYNWDLADATVVCRQLGYPRAVEAPRYATFGAGSGPSWYYGVFCAGTELNLTQCYRWTFNFGSACSHSRDAGVVCASESRSTPCICHFHMIVKWASCVWAICVCPTVVCVYASHMLVHEEWFCNHGNGNGYLSDPTNLSHVLLHACDTHKRATQTEYNWL